MLEAIPPMVCVWNRYLWPFPLALNWNTADLIVFLLRVISPAVGGENEVLSSPSSCSIWPRSFSVLSTFERMIKASFCCMKSPSCTDITTGDSKLLTNCPSPPTTVIFWLNVTGVSNVVTNPPSVSSSSPSSSSIALSMNVSSPVIALILLLPIYKSPCELIPV